MLRGTWGDIRALQGPRQQRNTGRAPSHPERDPDSPGVLLTICSLPRTRTYNSSFNSWLVRRLLLSQHTPPHPSCQRALKPKTSLTGNMMGTDDSSTARPPG